MIMSLKKVASLKRPHMSSELQTGPPPIKFQDSHAAGDVKFSVFKNSIPGMSIPLTRVRILP